MASMRLKAVLGGAAAMMAVAASLLPTAVATAADGPDAEVIFARGRFEPPGIGRIGQAFVDSLRRSSHLQDAYLGSGLVDQAARFTADRL